MADVSTGMAGDLYDLPDARTKWNGDPNALTGGAFELAGLSHKPPDLFEQST